MNKHLVTAAAFGLLNVSSVLAAVRGAGDTVLKYDGDGYKGAQWRLGDVSKLSDETVTFRRVTGWDKNTVIVLGASDAPNRGTAGLLIHRLVDGNWMPLGLNYDGQYGSYSARFYDPSHFMFAYNGRSGHFLSTFQWSAETKLGDFIGLRGALWFTTFYRVKDRVVFHPCRNNQRIVGDPQVYVYDGKSVEFLIPNDPGHFIEAQNGGRAKWTTDRRNDVEMKAGSIVAVHQTSESARVGVWNYALESSCTSWRTAIVSSRGEEPWKLVKLFSDVTKQFFSSWALSETQLVVSDFEAVYIVDGTSIRRIGTPGSSPVLHAWGKNLADFFVLTQNGSVYRLNNGVFQIESAGPDLKRDSSATAGPSREYIAKVRGLPQTLSDAWVSPEGLVFAIRSKDIYILEPK